MFDCEKKPQQILTFRMKTLIIKPSSRNYYEQVLNQRNIS